MAQGVVTGLWLGQNPTAHLLLSPVPQDCVELPFDSSSVAQFCPLSPPLRREEIASFARVDFLPCKSTQEVLQLWNLISLCVTTHFTTMSFVCSLN